MDKSLHPQHYWVGDNMAVSLICVSKLTAEQKEEIQTLQEQCRIHDGIKGSMFLENTLNFHSDMPCFFLLYEDNALTGILGAFAPTRLTAEICAYVLPQARRKGHFRRMLQEAVKVLKACGYESVVFVHEYKSKDAKDVIDRLPVELEHTEYLLYYSGINVQESAQKAEIAIREVEQADLKEIAALSGNIFGDSDISDSLTYKSFQDKNVRYYCAMLHAQIIGVCNVRQKDTEFSLYGFGIVQKYRGNGYGRAFLYRVIDALRQSQKDILLEVDSTNKRAFTLYTSSGFSIRTQFDYYEAKLDELSEKINDTAM